MRFFFENKSGPYATYGITGLLLTEFYHISTNIKKVINCFNIKIFKLDFQIKNKIQRK